jgi:uncharacterized membrane protein
MSNLILTELNSKFILLFFIIDFLFLFFLPSLSTSNFLKTSKDFYVPQNTYSSTFFNIFCKSAS